MNTGSVGIPVENKATLSIDVEEWFQVENLRSVCPKANWDSFESRVERNVGRILEILNYAGSKATFFILGSVAERFPKTVVNMIAKAGHEIASHGYGHDMLTEISDEDFRQDVLRSKSLLEDISGKRVYGYRAPNFSINRNALSLLEETGFVYDSSLNPTKISSRYGRLDMSAFEPAGKIFRVDSLYEIPMSTIDLLGRKLPMSGGGYFRLYPYAFFNYCAKRILKSKGFFNFYIHPWEIDAGVPKVSGLSADLKFRHYFNLERGEKRFEMLLKDFEFEPLISLIPVSQTDY